MLLAVVFMVHRAGTSDMASMAGAKFPKEVALWLWLAFFASFAVKTPVWPFHTWLPEAHVEAPTAGSVVLAGILLKLGGYGFIRISLRMFPEASAFFAPFVMALGVIAIIYASLAALAQTDMKKLIAYSSVAHMGYALIGIFSGNIHGIEGAVFVMLSHGLASAALFAGAGAIYERAHTRDMARLGGLAEAMPRCAFLFMIFTLCSVGLPGTFGFVGEFMVLNGAFSANAAYAVAASLGMVLGAAYMLKLYRALYWGKPCGKPVADLSGREFFMLAPLAVLIVWFGILPFQAKNVFEKTSVDMVASYHGGGK
jgi:NADH-quinone oxidoreductase subunit M